MEGKTDSLGFVRLLRKQKEKKLKKGYLLSHLAIDWSDTTKYLANLFTGSKFKWGQFNVDNVPEALLTKAGFRKNQFNEKPIDTYHLGSLLSDLIKNSEMNGYPFAKVRLDSVVIINDVLSAKVAYEQGPRIVYGAFSLSPNDLVKNEYMASYLGVRKGEVFNSKMVEKIPANIKGLTYCRLGAQPIVKFENKSCKISLDIKPVKANTIDALIGLAPNQDNKLLATGYVNLDLHNLFKSGKQLYFSWRQFGNQSQKLSTFYNHTNLFGSIINLKGAFELLKQDTTFINRNLSISIGYSQSAYQFNLTSKFIDSRLLSAVIQQAANVPEIDFDAQYYGVEFLKNEFNNKINPKHGWRIEASTSLGSKKLRPTDFVPSEAYDSLQEQMLQGIATVLGEGVFQVTKLIVLFGHAEYGAILSDGNLFSNDLFRLGGVNSIRGFNELEIYSSSYLLTQFEARLMLGSNSRLFGFVDWAKADNEVLNEKGLDYLGLGTGILLETKAGVVQLVFAVGKSAQQSLSLTESKIHVGYVARF